MKLATTLATLLSLAPAAVTDLTVTGTSPTGVTLQWTVPTTAESYEVRWSTLPIAGDADFEGAKGVRGAPATAGAGQLQSMTLLGLPSSTLLYFAMKVTDKLGESSALSNVASGTTLPADVTPPAAVSDLAAAGLSLSAQLKWSAPADAALYDLRLSPQPIGDDNDFGKATPVSGEPAPGEAGAAEGVTVTGLDAGTTYYFALKVADAYGNWSELSNEATATAAGEGQAPETVKDLTVTVATESMLGLSWTAPENAAQADVRWSAAPITGNAEFAAAAAVPGTAVSSLAPGTRYYFAMKTADVEGNWSELSNLAIGETLAATAPVGTESKTSKCGLLGIELVILLALLRRK